MTTDNCHHCNAELEPGFDLCWKCGADVDGGEPPKGFAEEAEDLAQLQTELAQEREQREEGAFLKTWAGQAREARAAGQTVFQMDVPLSKTRGKAIPMIGALANSTAPSNSSHVIQEIESQGWRLEHVGYVYRLTGSDSRDKFMMSGQQEAYSGELVGIYLFRVAA